MNDQELKIKNFSQTWPKPSKNNPIVIIGTGGIVKDAHLPAYKKAGFEVIGLYDVDELKAKELAIDFNINKVSFDKNELSFYRIHVGIESNEEISRVTHSPEEIIKKFKLQL